jgi:vitamin B12 transporter
MKQFYPAFCKFGYPARVGLLLLPVMLVSLSGLAQSDTTKKLKQVNIKATPAPNAQRLTPVQQFNAGDIARYSAFNVADAIRNFAGVNIKDYGGIGGLKTVSVRSLGANHTAVLFDGVQLNDAQGGQIDLSKFNLANVQEITLYNGQPEVLLQPARSFASASVLSIKTIQPILTADKPFKIVAGAKGGTFGLINPYLQWQQRMNGNWSAAINANYISANGRYKYKVEGDRSDTLAIRRNGYVKTLQPYADLYWKKNDSNKFNLHINYYNAKRGLPGAVIFYNPQTGQQLDNEDVFVQGAYQKMWRSGVALLLNSKVSQLNTRYLDPNFLNEQGFLNQHYKQREYYQSAAVTYHLLPNWEVSYSADFSRANVDADISKYAYPTRTTVLNVLASNYKTGRWVFQGNLLQTNIHESVKAGTASKEQSVLTPTLMASVKPFGESNIQLRAFYKSIFRAPTLDELYFFAFVPRTIKPEFVKQYDLGFTWSKNFNNILEYITLTTDAYYNDVSNKIVAVPNPAVSSYTNLGKVNIKGIDAGIKTQTQAVNGFTGFLTANYTYQLAQDLSNQASANYRNQILYTPKNTVAANAGISYKKLGVYYNYIFSSSRYYTVNNDAASYLPGYSISDASVVYSFTAHRLPMQASLETNNLFNKNYAIIRSYPMPGRSFRLSIQITI